MRFKVSTVSKHEALSQSPAPKTKQKGRERGEEMNQRREPRRGEEWRGEIALRYII